MATPLPSLRLTPPIGSAASSGSRNGLGRPGDRTSTGAQGVTASCSFQYCRFCSVSLAGRSRSTTHGGPGVSVASRAGPRPGGPPAHRRARSPRRTRPVAEPTFDELVHGYGDRGARLGRRPLATRRARLAAAPAEAGPGPGIPPLPHRGSSPRWGGSMSGDTLPTWEELLRGSAGVPVPTSRPDRRAGSGRRRATSGPSQATRPSTHSSPRSTASVTGAAEWDRIVRGLRAGDGLTWREAWAWTLLATACAALATRGAALLALTLPVTARPLAALPSIHSQREGRPVVSDRPSRAGRSRPLRRLRLAAGDPVRRTGHCTSGAQRRGAALHTEGPGARGPRPVTFGLPLVTQRRLSREWTGGHCFAVTQRKRLS